MARRRLDPGLRQSEAHHMIAEFGSFALILGLAFAIAQAGLSAAARLRRSTVLAAAGEGAALASFAGVAIAFACLIHAFVTSDFSVANVAANSHTEKPMLYKVAGAGGRHARPRPAAGPEGGDGGGAGGAGQRVPGLHGLRLQPAAAHPPAAGGGQ